MNYLTSINETNKAKVVLLIDASIQAYNAFNSDKPAEVQTAKISAPEGYEYLESWSGVDAVFGHQRTLECYGLVFRTKAEPYHYIFAFRGTSSSLDALDDLGAILTHFSPHGVLAPAAMPDIPGDLRVESGFFDVYSEADQHSPSMQQQLFELIDHYQASDKPIAHLDITGHSLGSALSELFTLDLALSRPDISVANINYACPRVGNEAFVRFYDQQIAQKNPQTQTLRVQNTHDLVPCVPPENMGYGHIPRAYLVAFKEHAALEELNPIARHSSANYQAVILAAAQAVDGVCINNKLEVPANGYAVCSEAPDEKDIGSYFG
jgi:hypothetical protein